MTESAVLDEIQLPAKERRRKLLPIWIKIFVWIFMIFGVIAPVGLILGVLGIDFNLALYGLETMEPLSGIGLSVILLFALKGAVSYGLWTEKDWGVNLAIIDAALGIAICVIVMIIVPFLYTGSNINIRLELIALIPYLIKMNKIKSEWKSRK